MDLTCRQMQTLRNIYEAAGHSHDAVQYCAKRLAPHTLRSNATAFFERLNRDGLVERYYSEAGSTIGVRITKAGLDVLIRQYTKIWPSDEMADEIRHQRKGRRRFLPDLFDETGCPEMS